MNSLAIERLNALPKPKRVYPPGNKHAKLSKALATRFCDLMATSLDSIPTLLRNNPQFPPFKKLDHARTRIPWFREMWLNARKAQAEFLIQHCLDLARTTTAKTAHETRVKFDVYRFIASKFHPDVYGDRSQQQQQQTTVNVGVSISAERLGELRTKLDLTRNHFKPAVLDAKHALPNGDNSPVCEEKPKEENASNNHQNIAS